MLLSSEPLTQLFFSEAPLRCASRAALFCSTVLWCTVQLAHFLQLCVKQVCWCQFSHTCSLHVSVSLWYSLQHFRLFRFICYGDQWSAIFDVTIAKKKITPHWRFRWWLSFFSNKVFFNYGVYTYIYTLIFRHNVIAHLLCVQNSVKHNFHVPRKPKNLCDLLYWDIYYCSGLDQNLQYLWGLPVLVTSLVSVVQLFSLVWFLLRPHGL